MYRIILIDPTTLNTISTARCHTVATARNAARNASEDGMHAAVFHTPTDQLVIKKSANPIG